MSEQGWTAFITADDLEDWVVLHGGAVAVFRVESMAAASALARAISHVPGLAGTRTLLTVAEGTLSVRLAHGVFRIEPEHVELARAISAVARDHSATADRAAVHGVQLAIAAKPADLDVGFWRAVLGYRPLAGDNAIDPLGHGSSVWMQDLDEAKPLRHAMHIDVSMAREQLEAHVAVAVAAGGRIARDPRPPDWSAWTLADRAGSKVDVTAWPDAGFPDGDGAATDEETDR